MPKFERTQLQRRTLLVLFVLAVYLFGKTLEPIWVPLFLGMVIAVGAHPLQEKLVEKFGGKRAGLAAGLITAGVMIFVMALFAFLLFVVGHRVIEVAQEIADRYENKGTAAFLGQDVVRIFSRFGVEPDSLHARVAEAARDIAKFVGKGATGIVAGFFSAIFIFIFTALTSYYLLREGNDGTSWLVEVVPLPNGQVAQIVRDVRDVTRAMLMSTGVMTLYQGLAAGIGYWIFGVDSPLVWASLTGIASIMPAVGTALVWAPVGFVLMGTHHFYKGLGVLLWGTFIVVFIADYILRPRLVGTKMKMNDLLVFIAIFGGIEAFGILGLVLGPIAVGVLLSLIRLYQAEYRPEGPVRAPDVTTGLKE